MDLEPLPVIGGYVYAIVGSRLAGWVLNAMPQAYQVIERAERVKALGHTEVWHRGAFGIVEASTIATGIMLGIPAVIPAWLVFKAALAWGGWKDEAGTFNRYAVGTVISIAFGAAGGALAVRLSTPLCDPWVIGGLVVGPLALAVLVRSLYVGPKWWKDLMVGQ